MSNEEIKFAGMQVLREKLGVIDAERFIMSIRADSAEDYTRWRRQWIDDMTDEEADQLVRDMMENENIQ